ncbi:ankyrin repeat domain-containing protein [Mucilaginibacter celer]|uniref:Ankyrin repeat domain-containing protein n=1 Tax=Mucilaginibacter celer TaxID=2305508 RepID=A0A494VNV9_9SPHI|nr:ankyrin repeat domain-containing protein [Mucilaginibacter celer]AYL95909.1 ankyrin repeat domain-containing protein [Mucilaginibacter celer]
MKKRFTLLSLLLVCSLPIFAQNIFTAIGDNDVQGVKFLLNRGVNLKAKDQNGNTPLIAAVKNNQDRIVNLILQTDVKVDGKDADGNTALMIAADKGNDVLVGMLLHYYPNTNAHNAGGATALMMAVNSGNANAVKSLLEHGANPKLKDKQHKAAIDYAKETDKQQMASLLDNTYPVTASIKNTGGTYAIPFQ